jgi:hypothetical protein
MTVSCHLEELGIMRRRGVTGRLLAVAGVGLLTTGMASAASIVENNQTRVGEIPTAWINKAKATLNTASGLPAPGSQPLTEMAAVRNHGTGPDRVCSPSVPPRGRRRSR